MTGRTKHTTTADFPNALFSNYKPFSSTTNKKRFYKESNASTVQIIPLQTKLLSIQNKKIITPPKCQTTSSASEVHAATNRLKESYLLDTFSGNIRKASFEEFLVHGIQYVFPAVQDKPVRGLFTAHSSPFIKDEFASNSDPIVWPYSSGKDRGIAIAPLYKTVPEVCSNDSVMYHWLSVIDLLRLNRPREREIALSHLKKLFEDIK